jgi:hypothetical protein
MAKAIDQYEPKQVNLKAIRRESESRINASITRLGSNRDENSVDPYDNTPTFAKNKDQRFKSQQTGYTNTLLEKILEGQNNKDAWNATQEYYKKSLDYFDKIYSKLKQAIPDKKEQDEEFQKTKMQCTAITRAILSGDGGQVGKLVWEGIKAAKTPMMLQTFMPMIQTLMSMGDASTLAEMAAEEAFKWVVDKLPETMGYYIDRIKTDLPSLVDAQLVQMYNSLSSFNKKSKGNKVSSDLLEIMSHMGISSGVGGSIVNLQQKSRNFKEQMTFDRAFYETVTNGIPQQLARIEQAIRGGYVYYWQADKGKFQRMDSKAYEAIRNPLNSQGKLYKETAQSFMYDIVDNYDLGGAAQRAGIHIVRDKKGKRMIGSKVIDAVWSVKITDLLTRNGISARIDAINANTKLAEIIDMISPVLGMDPWTEANGYLKEFKRDEVEDANEVVNKQLVNLFAQLKHNIRLKSSLQNAVKNAVDSANNYAEELSYSNGPTIDLETIINSGAHNLSGALRRSSRGGSKTTKDDKYSMAKTYIGLYKAEVDEEKIELNKTYSKNKLSKILSELIIDEADFDYASKSSSKANLVNELKKDFLNTVKGKDLDSFLESCLNHDGNIDYNLFSKKMADYIVVNNVDKRLSSSVTDYLNDHVADRKLKQNKNTFKNRQTIAERMSDEFKNALQHHQYSNNQIELMAKEGSNILRTLLEKDQVSLKHLGIETATITKITKDVLKSTGMVTNPIAGTFIGSMLSGGAIFLQQTKYFKTLAGTNPYAQDSDGNMTNQQRVMTDLLVNKAGPLLAALGVGGGVRKVLRKLGPMASVIGLPAAITTGVITFGATTMAKGMFGDAIVGEKTKGGGRQGRNWFTKGLRDIMSFIPGVNTMLQSMDSDADKAEKLGLKYSEFRKEHKQGGLYREGNSGIRISSNGDFTITAQVEDGKDKDGNTKTAKKTATGSIKTKALKEKMKQLRTAMAGMRSAYKDLDANEREEYATNISKIASSLTVGTNTDGIIAAIKSKSPALAKYSEWAFKVNKLQAELDSTIKDEANIAFDAAINDSPLKSLDQSTRDSLREQYIMRESIRFRESELGKILYPDDDTDNDSKFDSFKRGVKGVYSHVVGSIGDRFANSDSEILSSLGETLQGHAEDIKTDKQYDLEALNLSQVLTGLVDDKGVLLNHVIADEKNRVINEDGKQLDATTGEAIGMDDGKFKLSSVNIQSAIHGVLSEISAQLNRLYYESLPVYIRLPNTDIKPNFPFNEEHDFNEFKRLAGTHVGYKSSSNGMNKFTKDGRAYCAAGTRQTAIQALGKEKANQIFNGTIDMGDPTNIARSYTFTGKWRARNVKPNIGDEVFFNRKNGQYHMGIVMDVNGDKIKVQEYNAEGGKVAINTYSWDELSKGGHNYDGSGALGWNGPTSNIAPDLQPGTIAGPEEDYDSMLKTNMLVAHNLSPLSIATGMSNMSKTIGHGFNGTMTSAPSKGLTDPIPVSVVMDTTKIADTDNNEAARDMVAMNRSVLSYIHSSETKKTLSEFIDANSKLRRKPGVRAEHEQSERIEDALEKGGNANNILKSGGSTTATRTTKSSGGYKNLKKEEEKDKEGESGDSTLDKAAKGSLIWSGLKGAGKVLGKFAKGPGMKALNIGGTIAGAWYGLKAALKYTGAGEHLSNAKEYLDDLTGSNEAEGAYIDGEGNVVKTANSHSTANGMRGAKNLIGAGYNAFKGAMTGGKIGNKVFSKPVLKGALSKILHPKQTIEGLSKTVAKNGGVKQIAGDAVKSLSDKLMGAVAKGCEYLAKLSYKWPFSKIGGGYLGRLLDRISKGLKSFTDDIAKGLVKNQGKIATEAAKKSSKSAGKSIPFLNIAIYGGLMTWSAIDGYRNADYYLGLVTKGTEKKDRVHTLSRSRKLFIGVLKALYDNLIGILFAIFGSGLAIGTLGLGGVGSAILGMAVESVFHWLYPWDKFVLKFGTLFADEDDLREMRLDNAQNSREKAEANALESEADNAAKSIKDEDENKGKPANDQSKSVYQNIADYGAKLNAQLEAEKQTRIQTNFDEMGDSAERVAGIARRTWNSIKSVASKLVNPNANQALNVSKLTSYSGGDYNTAVQALINNAESQVGYAETGNNHTIYADEVGAPNNQPWCSTFQDWVFQKTFGKESAAALLGGSSSQPSTWGRAKKLMAGAGGYTWNNGGAGVDPQPGDLVFFKFGGASHNNPTNHIGLVTGVNDDGTVNTIEGNTSMSVGNQRMGGRVARKTRKYKGGGSIVGFGRPDWSQIGATATNATQDDGQLKPGEQAGIMDTLGSLERGLETVHRGTRAAGNIKRSAEAMKRTMAHTKEANKGKSFWEKTKNNTRAAASMIGSAANVAGNIAQVTGNTKVGQMASNVADSMQMADRYARTAARQMDAVSGVITSVQTKTAGGIIDAVQSSGHILSSGFGGLMKGMDVNTRKLDQMCNTGDRTIRVLEEIKGILGRGNFIADNAGVAAIS